MFGFAWAIKALGITLSGRLARVTAMALLEQLLARKTHQCQSQCATQKVAKIDILSWLRDLSMAMMSR